MSRIYEVKADLRTDSGKSSARGLRGDGKLPAVIYGKGIDTKAISLEKKDIDTLIRKGHFYTQVCEISVGKEKINVIPRVIDFHPVSDQPLHIDFYQLNDKEKVKIRSNISFSNEAQCVGVKKGGVINVTMREIELYCFPKNIPDVRDIEVDLSDLGIGGSIHATDLKLPEGVESAVTAYAQTIVTIVGRAVEEEAPSVEAVAEEVKETEEVKK